MTNLDDIDYFFDSSLLANAHPYFDHLRGKGPVVRMPGYDNVVVVTGYDEGLAVSLSSNPFGIERPTFCVGAAMVFST